MFKKFIKKHLPWMLASYILVMGATYYLFLVPRKALVSHYRSVKERVEYNYLRTRSPAFLAAMDNAVQSAEEKVHGFEWLYREEVDVNLAFYNYLYRLAGEHNISLVELSMVDTRTARTTGREEHYHAWQTSLRGTFPNLLGLITAIETNQNFLVVEEIAVTPARERTDETRYDITFLGLKRGSR